MIRPRTRYTADDQPYVDAWQHRAGDGGWLSYHLHRGAPSEFGRNLLGALRDIDGAIPNLGTRLISELAAIRHVPAADDAAAWQAGFQQLLQLLAEVLVIRALCNAGWPEGAVLQYEPVNPTTGRRPELSVELGDQILLIEVKCPALIDHQNRRVGAEYHLPARGVAGELFLARGEPARLALPRDNAVKDFLISADEKFRGFSQTKSVSGVLVIVWDQHLYEPISSLRHPESGLFTDNSFARTAAGDRLPFDAVGGAVVLEGLERLGAAAQETERADATDPFSVNPRGMPSAWCPNRPDAVLHAGIGEALAAQPIEDLDRFAQYRPQDIIFWIDPAVR